METPCLCKEIKYAEGKPMYYVNRNGSLQKIVMTKLVKNFFTKDKLHFPVYIEDEYLVSFSDKAWAIYNEGHCDNKIIIKFQIWDGYYIYENTEEARDAYLDKLKKELNRKIALETSVYESMIDNFFKSNPELEYSK